MDNQNDKLMAILAYIIFFIPLLAVRNRSEFLNFHTNQGIILAIFSFAGWFLLLFIPLGFVYQIFSLLILVFVILGIRNVLNHEMKELPIIGGLFKIL
jgi:uncharacterized membrane protein